MNLPLSGNTCQHHYLFFLGNFPNEPLLFEIPSMRFHNRMFDLYISKKKKKLHPSLASKSTSHVLQQTFNSTLLVNLTLTVVSGFSEWLLSLTSRVTSLCGEMPHILGSFLYTEIRAGKKLLQSNHHLMLESLHNIPHIWRLFSLPLNASIDRTSHLIRSPVIHSLNMSYIHKMS